VRAIKGLLLLLMNLDDKDGAPVAEIPQSHVSPSFELQRPRAISEYEHPSLEAPLESKPEENL